MRSELLEAFRSRVAQLVLLDPKAELFPFDFLASEIEVVSLSWVLNMANRPLLQNVEVLSNLTDCKLELFDLVFELSLEVVLNKKLELEGLWLGNDCEILINAKNIYFA